MSQTCRRRLRCVFPSKYSDGRRVIRAGTVEPNPTFYVGHFPFSIGYSFIREKKVDVQRTRCVGSREKFLSAVWLGHFQRSKISRNQQLKVPENFGYIFVGEQKVIVQRTRCLGRKTNWSINCAQTEFKLEVTLSSMYVNDDISGTWKHSSQYFVTVIVSQYVAFRKLKDWRQNQE